MALTRARATVMRGCALITVAVMTSCSATPEPSSPSSPPVLDSHLASDLVRSVTTDNLMVHLQKLQQIADAHGGNRAEGTPGYDASVDYVAQTLKDNGFDVQTPELTRLKVGSEGKPTISVAGQSFPVDQASYFVQTPQGGLKGTTIRPSKNPSGCAASDYGDLKISGAIAVVNGTGCSVVEKQNVAKDKGAAGVLVTTTSGIGDGLFSPNYYEQLAIPVAIVDASVDAALRRTGAPVTLVLDMDVKKVLSRSVIAQTTTGDPSNVTVVGAHLDSSTQGPGINDNGTGVASLLETALQLGAKPVINNAVRFAFWAGGASAAGSLEYLKDLKTDQLNDIALYLNVDTVGSSNAGYFVLDGDLSAAKSDPTQPPLNIAAGSAGIKRVLSGHLDLAGKSPASLPFSGTSDFGPFMSAGIPVGGITSGRSGTMNALEARLWEGRAGQPFDLNNTGPKDTIAAVNKGALEINARTVAFAVGTYAMSITGPNGVPARKDRHRTGVH